MWQRRAFHSTSLHAAGRHPLIRCRNTSRRPKDASSEPAAHSVADDPLTAVFQGPFKVHEQWIRDPDQWQWIPEEERPRVQLQRERNRLRREREAQVARWTRQWPEPVTEASLVGEPPAPHPDPMVHYRQQAAHLRAVYAQQVQERRQQQLQPPSTVHESESGNRTATLASDTAHEATPKAQATEPGRSELLDRFELCRQALDRLEEVCGRQLREESHDQVLAQHRQRRLQALVRLHQRASQFIDVDQLDLRIDHCLQHPAPQTALIPFSHLIRMGRERVRREREDALYDVLNETLDRGPTVSTVMRTRDQEQRAVASLLAESVRTAHQT